MSTDALLRFALAFTGGLFAAGGFYVYVRLSLQHLEKKIDKNHDLLKADLSGIGYKVARNEIAAARRYHNHSLAIMHSCPVDKEAEISHLMKEDG